MVKADPFWLHNLNKTKTAVVESMEKSEGSGIMVPSCECEDCGEEAPRLKSIDPEESTTLEENQNLAESIGERFNSIVAENKINRLNSRIEELKNLLSDWEIYCEELKKNINSRNPEPITKEEVTKTTLINYMLSQLPEGDDIVTWWIGLRRYLEDE